MSKNNNTNVHDVAITFMLLTFMLIVFGTITYLVQNCGWSGWWYLGGLAIIPSIRTGSDDKEGESK